MKVRRYRILPVTAVLMLLLIACTGFARDINEDSLWIETSQALQANNASEAQRLLRLCVLGQINLPESEKLLRQSLASDAALISTEKSLKELQQNQLIELFRLQREICKLGVAEADDWLNLLRTGAAMPDSENLIISGQDFLKAVQHGLPVQLNDEWLEFLRRFEREMIRDEQVLYRRQIVQIFANLEPESKEMQNRLADIELLAEAKSIKILGLAEVEIALGNLNSARAYLDQVKNYNSQYIGLKELYQRLEKAERIDKILIKANDALLSKRYDEAKRHVEEILRLDANNFFARRITEQIEAARSRPITGSVSAEDRIKLRIRRIEVNLRKAEKEQDLQQIFTLLREILMIKSDLPEYAQRLTEVEQEIALSKLKADERFAEAEDLFKKAEYAKLRFFLNRNPGLMNSVEKMLQIWEMRLMANLATGHLETPQLREAAETIIKKAGKSFYASYVLMRLSIAENKLVEARAHYKIAAELKPGDTRLRWPGILLWVHGEGRPVAVILLIVVFVLMIKLIHPFFSWFESTYWWRISILAKIFPSLAIRSLEGCFGTVKERSERIILFTLLMKSCYRVGNSNKALLYSDNLLDIVPGNAAALEIRAKIRAKSGATVKSDSKKVADVPATELETEIPSQSEERQVIVSGLQREIASELPGYAAPVYKEEFPEEESKVYAESEPLDEFCDNNQNDGKQYTEINSFEEPEFLKNAEKEEYAESADTEGSEYIENMEDYEDVDDEPFFTESNESLVQDELLKVDLNADTDSSDCLEDNSTEQPVVDPQVVASAQHGAISLESEDSSEIVAEDFVCPPTTGEEEEDPDEKSVNDGIGDAAAELFKDFFPEPETRPLRNQPTESKIEQKRLELFAELDSIQPPQQASDTWLEYCSRDINVDKWFKELDQGR